MAAQVLIAPEWQYMQWALPAAEAGFVDAFDHIPAQFKPGGEYEKVVCYFAAFKRLYRFFVGVNYCDGVFNPFDTRRNAVFLRFVNVVCAVNAAAYQGKSRLVVMSVGGVYNRDIRDFQANG